MTFEREDFARLKQQAFLKDSHAKTTSRLTLIKQGAVVGESMTGVPAWDTFLSFVQGAIDTTREQLAALGDTLASPDVLDHDRLLQIKVSMIRCKERISAWEAIVKLPKDLIEHGEQTQSLLDRMEHTDGDNRGSDRKDRPAGGKAKRAAHARATL